MSPKYHGIEVITVFLTKVPNTHGRLQLQFSAERYFGIIIKPWCKEIKLFSQHCVF